MEDNGLRLTKWQRFWAKMMHPFGCTPEPRPPLYLGQVWAARHCAICHRYPCGPWRLPMIKNEDWK